MRMKVAILMCGAALAATGCKKKGTGGGGGGGWFVGEEGLMVNVDPSPDTANVDRYDLGETEHLEAIACRHRAEAWVAGAHGTLLYTNDGGDEWVSHVLPTRADLHAIATQDAGPVFIAGDGVFFTAVPDLDTGAASWTQLGDGRTSFRSVAAARTSDTVLAVSADGGVWSYEGGALTRRSSVAGADAIAVSFDGTTALIAGSGLSRSTDGGRTWSALAIEPSVRFSDIRIDEGGEAVAVGDAGVIARIDREGRVLTQTVGTADLRAVYLPSYESSEGVGYAAGDDGQIWLTRDAGWTWDAGPNAGHGVLAVDEIGAAHR
jgi:photosystem II stability/assembly factor-like uncharacterized protein